MYSIVKRGQVYQPTLSGNGKVIAWRDLPKPGVSEIAIQREGEEAKLFTDDGVADQAPRLNYDGSVVVWERHAGGRAFRIAAGLRRWKPSVLPPFAGNAANSQRGVDAGS